MVMAMPISQDDKLTRVLTLIQYCTAISILSVNSEIIDGSDSSKESNSSNFSNSIERNDSSVSSDTYGSSEKVTQGSLS